MANMVKQQTPRVRRRPHRAAPVRRTRLIDLTGPKLYAMIVYRLSMTIIISLVLLKMGNGS